MLFACALAELSRNTRVDGDENRDEWSGFEHGEEIELCERREEDILAKVGNRLGDAVWEGHESGSVISCLYMITSIHGTLTCQRH